MKLGVFLGNVNERTGGEFSFQDSIVSALEQVEGRHDIFVFHYGKGGGARSVGKVTYVPLLSNVKPIWLFRRGLDVVFGRKSKSSLLHLATDDYGIDLMWFPSLHFVPLEVPYICTVLDLEHRVHPFFPEVGVQETWQWREQFYASMIPRAAFVITGTEAGKHQILDFYKPCADRVRVIPLPVSTFALAAKEAHPPDLEQHGIRKPYLFYPAQFWPHKNHVVLLRALKLLRERNSLDLEVVFCGSDKGNLDHVKEVSRELGVEESVHFLGFVSRDELCALYSKAFALVYPSFFGPDNLPPLEAFASGCPVICSREAGSQEQLGDSAILVDACQEQEIASAVLHLWKEPEIRQSLIENGNKLALRWTPFDYVERILGLCDEFELFRRCWSRTDKYVPR